MQRILPIPRPRRWDQPFSPRMSEREVNRIITLAPFRQMDPSGFAANVPLRGILRNDTAVHRYRAGDIIVREGDYRNSAFFVMEGRVALFDGKSLPGALLGRRESRHKGVVDALRQLWNNAKYPEVRKMITGPSTPPFHVRVAPDQRDTVSFVDDLPALAETHHPLHLTGGTFFGEVEALTRSANNGTAIAESDAQVLEIRWQGLRELMRGSAPFKAAIEGRYRERAMQTHLRECALFRNLEPAALNTLADETRFESYGNFDWHVAFRAGSAQSRIELEPLIAAEGNYVDGLILIRAGFARVSRRISHGQLTVGYLGPGDVFGFDEMAHNWQSQERVPLQTSLRALGYVDVLRVPSAHVDQLVLPSLPERDLPPRLARTVSAPSPWRGSTQSAGIDAGLLEFFVDQRFLNGTATMVIDLDRCTRCDACVEACSTTHDNNPRFIRHGKQFDRLMVANACMHCLDPVCMIGCPTGAIHRSKQGPIIINDRTCIGCATCANSCPYDNIRMVEIRDQDDRFIVDESTMAPILKATKCDLCIDQPSGPACQNACPYNALRRVDMRDMNALSRWLRC